MTGGTIYDALLASCASKRKQRRCILGICATIEAWERWLRAASINHLRRRLDGASVVIRSIYPTPGWLLYTSSLQVRSLTSSIDRSGIDDRSGATGSIGMPSRLPVIAGARWQVRHQGDSSSRISSSQPRSDLEQNGRFLGQQLGEDDTEGG